MPPRKTKTSTPPIEAAAPEPAAKPSKLDLVIALLARPEGASLADLQAATGWQAHSVRGAIAGAVPKKLGQRVLSQKTEAGRIYCLAEAAKG